MATLESVALGLSLTVVVLFGVAAVAYAFWRQHKQQHPDSPEFFLTARRSVGAFTIAWAFYAGAMGSWALFGPPSYGIYAGTLGVIMYAFASGLPILIIGALGGVIHDMVPNVLSFADFVNRRFGIVLATYVALLMLFNMGVAITAEYTAVGDLFEYIIGTTRIPVVVTIGCVSILYTAAGGLFVSIITDQWQAVCNVVFIAVLVVYVGVTYREEVVPAPDWSNPSGYDSIAAMPISLITSTLFSEAMWQRCWATESRKKLLLGSAIGGVMVMVAVMIFAMGGLLVLWGGLFNIETDNPNTILFSLFKDDWVIIIATLLAVVMSESAVDSLQNAIVDTMATTIAMIAAFLSQSFPSLTEKGGVFSLVLAWMRDLNMWWMRSLVLVLNVAPIVVSLQGYNVLQLFLIANLMTATTAVPVFCGVFPGRLSRMIVTPFSVLFGCANGIAGLFWWAAIDAQQQEIPYSEALRNTFFGLYRWQPFLIAVGMSIAGMLVGALLEFAARKIIPGWGEYPQFDLNASTGLQGGVIISDSTADIMVRAYTESSEEQQQKLKGEVDVGVDVYESGQDANADVSKQNPYPPY